MVANANANVLLPQPLQLLIQSPGHINPEQFGRYNDGQFQSSNCGPADVQGHNSAPRQNTIGRLNAATPRPTSVDPRQSTAPENADSPSEASSTTDGLGEESLVTPAANQVLPENTLCPAQAGDSQTQDVAAFDKTISKPSYDDPTTDNKSLASNLVAGQNGGPLHLTGPASANLTRVASSGMTNNELPVDNEQRGQNIPSGDLEDHIHRETTAFQHLKEGTFLGRAGIDAQPSLKPVDQPIRSKKRRTTRNPFVEKRDTLINNAAPGLANPSPYINAGPTNPQLNNTAHGLVDPSQYHNAGPVNPQLYNTAHGLVDPSQYHNAGPANPQLNNTAHGLVNPSQHLNAGPANPQLYNTAHGLVDPSQYLNAGPANPQLYNTAHGLVDPSQYFNAGPANPQLNNTAHGLVNPSQHLNAGPANPQLYNTAHRLIDPSQYLNAGPANPQLYNTAHGLVDPSQYHSAGPANPQFYNTAHGQVNPSQHLNAGPGNPQLYNTAHGLVDPSQYFNAGPANPQLYNGTPSHAHSKYTSSQWRDLKSHSSNYELSQNAKNLI